jgi:phosphoenolpyruvate---glycerone phosphotransferase subunit DhaL
MSPDIATPAGAFPASRGRVVIDTLVATIDANTAMLSEIDGAIGDGDHGINMRKGFLMARDELPSEVDLSTGLTTLGEALLTRIGGAMGPLYGSFFTEMGGACAGLDSIDATTFGRMLSAGREIVEDLGEARVGDKTLLDTLVPATDAYQSALTAGGSFPSALVAMADAAERGKDSTRDLVARVGRASRLGERSRGVLDAGATSCWLLLTAMAHSIRGLLAEEG